MTNLGQQRNKYLLKNTVIFSIGNFGTKIISFFLVPLYTNILTTREYGTVDLIYTIGMVLVPLLTLILENQLCDLHWIKMLIATK